MALGTDSNVHWFSICFGRPFSHWISADSSGYLEWRPARKCLLKSTWVKQRIQYSKCLVFCTCHIWSLFHFPINLLHQFKFPRKSAWNHYNLNTTYIWFSTTKVLYKIIWKEVRAGTGIQTIKSERKDRKGRKPCVLNSSWIILVV